MKEQTNNYRDAFDQMCKIQISQRHFSKPALSIPDWLKQKEYLVSKHITELSTAINSQFEIIIGQMENDPSLDIKERNQIIESAKNDCIRQIREYATSVKIKHGVNLQY